ncbi:hypothetical protein KUCAC02_036926, partial [Chaenocephalus aceratus]
RRNTFIKELSEPLHLSRSTFQAFCFESRTFKDSWKSPRATTHRYPTHTCKAAFSALQRTHSCLSDMGKDASADEIRRALISCTVSPGRSASKGIGFLHNILLCFAANNP